MVLTPNQRAQILIDYFKTDQANISEIARNAKCSPKSVRNIVKQWQNRKTIAYQTSPGARSKIDSSVMELFYAYAASPEGKTKTLKQLKAKFPLVKYSVSHISRLLVKRGMRCFVQKKKPALEPHHITDRLTFANANEFRNWDQVVFSDEKTVYSRFTGRRLIRRQRGEPDTMNHVPVKVRKVKVNLWGYITTKFWGLYLLPDNANGEDYLKLLQTSFLPTIKEQMDEFVFMQDGASIHNQAKNLPENEKIPFFVWPARSPDLNPIENIWGIMQKYLNKWFVEKGTPTNRTQLFSLCKKIFGNVCKKHANTVMKSMNNRIQKTIEANGGTTKY